MIISEKSATPVKSTIDNKKEFHVNESSLMFEVVSVGLYTHGIAAVVRELCCNAYDSHKEAGKLDVPFNVVFPTIGSQVFIVEDFGIGMTREGVENNICGIFNSTKNQTDDYIGGLGLGSKTPFIISDTFTIRARKNGEENTFAAYLTEDRKPHVSLIGSRRMEEPDGVRIEVPVSDEHDIRDFEIEARAIFSFLRPNVNTHHSENNEFKLSFPNVVDDLEKTPIIFGTFGNTNSALYRQIKHYDKNNGPSLTVVMGGVAYPMGYLKELVKDRGLYYKMAVLCQGEPVIIKADIGEMRVNPSRETLRRDAANINALLKKIEPFVKSIEEKIQGIVADSKFARDVVLKMADEFFPGDYHKDTYTIRFGVIASILSLIDNFDTSNKFDYQRTVLYSEMSCISECMEFGYMRKTRVRANGDTSSSYMNTRIFWDKAFEPNLEVVLLTSTEESRGRTPVYKKFGAPHRLVFVVGDGVPKPEALEFFVQFGAKITWLNLDEEYKTIKRERLALAAQKKKTQLNKDNIKRISIEGWRLRYSDTTNSLYYGERNSEFGQEIKDGSAVGRPGVLNPPESRHTLYVLRVAERFYIEEGGKELTYNEIVNMCRYFSYLVKDDPYVIIKTRSNAKYFNECGVESLANGFRKHIRKPARYAMDLLGDSDTQDAYNANATLDKFAAILNHPKAHQLSKVLHRTREKIQRQKQENKLYAFVSEVIGVEVDNSAEKHPAMVGYHRRFREVLSFRKTLKNNPTLSCLFKSVDEKGQVNDILIRSYIFTHHRKVWNKIVRIMGLTKEQVKPKFD